ncbi:MAG: radical SAM protein [Christensenellaceae bacterium]|nr:radical SAM protein [Christensenellaceae bacterium]
MFELYGHCTLCPRECGADRLAGNKGVCGMDAGLMLARAALHYWEEPCISGEEGSGTVFFSGCTLKCVYCQNAEISRGFGKAVGAERLTEVFLELQKAGANNINLVTPTHYVPHIITAAEAAREKGLVIPFVYNTSGYEREDTLLMLKDIIDIFLTDLKYLNKEDAEKLSRASDYPEKAKKALDCMIELTGPPVFDGHGMLKKGVIVRHLVLPGRANEAKRIIRYLYERYGSGIIMSIMNQYTPQPGSADYDASLESPVGEEEYSDVVDYAEELGIEDAYIQEGGTVSESFIPKFDLTGV